MSAQSRTSKTPDMKSLSPGECIDPLKDRHPAVTRQIGILQTEWRQYRSIQTLAKNNREAMLNNKPLGELALQLVMERVKYRLREIRATSSIFEYKYYKERKISPRKSPPMAS